MSTSGSRSFADADDARALLARLMQERYPPADSRHVDEFPMPPTGGWVLEHEGIAVLLRVPEIEPTVISVRAGVAIEIPRSEELAYYVAAHNKQVTAGRAYLAYGDLFALVVLEEITVGRTLSWDFEPTMRDFFRRCDYVIEHGAEMGAEILDRFGGRRFASEEWIHLVM